MRTEKEIKEEIASLNMDYGRIQNEISSLEDYQEVSRKKYIDMAIRCEARAIALLWVLEEGNDRKKQDV